MGRQTIINNFGLKDVHIFRIKCRYDLRQTKHFDKMFRDRRGGDVNSPLMEGKVETPEEWLARVAQSKTEVRNFR